MPSPLSPDDSAAKRIQKCARRKAKSLDLGGLGLSRLPAGISALVHLENLILCDNSLSSLPSSLSQLQSLRQVDLARNRFSAVPGVLLELSPLQQIDLSGNQLESLPDELKNLKQLKRLYAEENQLRSLPAGFAAIKLDKLALWGNKNLSIPPEIIGPSRAQKSEKCPLVKARDILDYYFSTRGDDGRALREVKLILVGRGEVGKTSMADILQDKRFIPGRKRTDGIVISPWPIELDDGPAKVLMWDFGGQEIMHGTHQFFLTHRSLYLVMVDGRHDRQNQDAEYWLKLVRAFGGDSTVMVVMNRQKDQPFEVDRQQLARKYGVRLEHFFSTDCAAGLGIEPLRLAIRAEAARMLAIEERFPSKCWEVKTRLEEMRKHGENYLSDEAYAAICAERQVVDEGEQQKLLRRLAELGSVVSFPDEVKLSALTVLNPEWVTDGIYRVVTNDKLRQQLHGQLDLKTLRQLLSRHRWPRAEHVRYVLDLMKKFELCFSVDGDEDAVLVPELLPDVTPPLDGWEPEKCVVFLYQYPVLPHGVLPRFITRTHASHGEALWRSGVVLRDDGAEALIKADYDSHRISVWLRGRYTDARRALLKVVRSHFASIHARIKDLKPEELVAIPGHPSVTLSYDDLVMDERDHKSSVRITLKGQRVEWKISELLNGVEAPEERRRSASRKDKDFQIIINQAGAIMNQSSFHDRHDVNIGGDVHNSQIGSILNQCSQRIRQEAPGQRRELLEKLEKQVAQLIAALPEAQKAEAADNLEMTVKQAVSATPNRKWYSVSAEGLIEAAKAVKGLTSDLAETLTTLGKTLWTDFA